MTTSLTSQELFALKQWSSRIVKFLQSGKTMEESVKLAVGEYNLFLKEMADQNTYRSKVAKQIIIEETMLRCLESGATQRVLAECSYQNDSN